jgi:calreticulin
MFGPDLCGYDVARVHLIFSKDGENMLKKDDIKLEWNDKNEFTHLYTLILNPDNTYKVLVDNQERASGNLGDGQWSKFPLKEIDDPEDKKPADWVEEARIVDPAAKKPEDWDEEEPKMIKDPAATKPSDWDDAEDGEWEAPMIDNPKYKGKWSAPMIDNPAFKGVWAPKKIPNKDYDGKSYIYKDIGAVGFELWVVNSGSIFSNLIITDSVEEAKELADKTFSPEFIEAEKAAKKAFDEKNKPADAPKEGDEAKDEEKEPEDLDEKEEL